MKILEQKIGYSFQNIKLLERALTHSSTSQKENNQRLEFLGDSVLSLIVSRILYDLFPSEQEGELARRRAALVCGETLSGVAREIGLGAAMNIGLSEKQSGGRDNSSNLEDALEALIGAIYLDGGLVAAEKFITSNWLELAKNSETAPKDAKTALQEWTQGKGLGLPVYKTLETTGAAHAPIFTIEVSITGYASATAQANSKKQAEQMAAGNFLERLKDGR